MTAGETIASFWPKQLPLCEFGVDATCWDDTHTQIEKPLPRSVHYILEWPMLLGSNRPKGPLSLARANTNAWT